MTTPDPLVLRLVVAIVVAIDVVLVGIARMALGAHYPTDVLAGLLGGIGVLGLYAWFTRRGAWADRPPADSPPSAAHGARDAGKGS